MVKTSNNKYVYVVILALFNPIPILAQKTYSGSYSIINLLTPEYENESKIHGIVNYNYIEHNEQRIYHGPFHFSTTQNPNPGDFLPSLIDLPTDSITISGLFNQGKKNGLWKIQGYGDNRKSIISIEMTYDNGVLDGPVKGSSSQNSVEICSFNYSLSKGLLNGTFTIKNNKIDYHGYGYPKINCHFNFSHGLFHGNNTISFFNEEDKEFILVRQYEYGLLYLDKFQDQSTGEYIINKRYNIDFSLPDFNYTHFGPNSYDTEKYLSGKVPAQNYYKNFFTLLSEISNASTYEVPHVGYFHTKNSEIFSLNGLGTVERAVAMGNHRYSFLSNKEKFIRETLPKDLWSDINLDADEKQRGNPFVDITNYENKEGINAVPSELYSLTQVNELIFELLNLIYIFPLGSDIIEIKPIKEPYIFVSEEAEEFYSLYRTKFLTLDSINTFKQDSIRFRSKILDDFESLTKNHQILNSQISLHYFDDGNGHLLNEYVQEVSNALIKQFLNMKIIDQYLSDQSNFKYVSEDLRAQQDSINIHSKGIQIRLEHLNNILLAINDMKNAGFDQVIFTNPKVQSQLKKFFEIPGANDRYNDNRQFIFRPDKSSEEELIYILQIINERKEIYSKIVKDNIRVSPTKYSNIDEFLKDLKTM